MPTYALFGKADAAGEATGTSNLQTVVVGAQASWERLGKGTSWYVTARKALR
jgi:hypothetical protein